MLIGAGVVVTLLLALSISGLVIGLQARANARTAQTTAENNADYAQGLASGAQYDNIDALQKIDELRKCVSLMEDQLWSQTLYAGNVVQPTTQLTGHCLRVIEGN
jgi:hypothetical protein